MKKFSGGVAALAACPQDANSVSKPKVIVPATKPACLFLRCSGVLMSPSLLVTNSVSETNAMLHPLNVSVSVTKIIAMRNG